MKFNFDSEAIAAAAAAMTATKVSDTQAKLIQLKPVVPNSELSSAAVDPEPHRDFDTPQIPGDVSALMAAGAGGAAGGAALGRRRRGVIAGPEGLGELVFRAVGKLSIRVESPHIAQLVELDSHTVRAVAPLIPDKKHEVDPKYAEEIMVPISIHLDVETGELSVVPPATPQSIGFHCNQISATLRDAEGGMRKKKNNATSGENPRVVSFGPLEEGQTAAEKYGQYYDSAEDWLGITVTGYYYYVVHR